MASPKVLTVGRIESAKPKEARYELPDAGLPGFYLVVQPSGAKSFALRYRAAGKPRKFTIGAYPQFTLEMARKCAREAIGKIARGAMTPPLKRRLHGVLPASLVFPKPSKSWRLSSWNAMRRRTRVSALGRKPSAS